MNTKEMGTGSFFLTENLERTQVEPDKVKYIYPFVLPSKTAMPPNSSPLNNVENDFLTKPSHLMYTYSHYTSLFHPSTITIFFFRPLSRSVPPFLFLSLLTMIDLQQGLDRNNLSSFRRVYQRSGKSTSSRTEFKFWDEKRTKIYENKLAVLESSQIEFQTATDEYSAYSPPFWASTRHEASMLLPRDHHYSVRSPTSPSQVMADGRRELMKMVQDMPESNYELSLKDIVDDRISMQEVQQDVQKKTERKKNKSYKGRQMLRSESMDSGVFLLKMFMPARLSSKKKPAVLGNCKKVSRMPSADGSEKPIDKEWWGVRFLLSRQSKNSRSTSSSSSSSSSGSTGCISGRNADSSFTPSWCSSDNLGKSRRQRGCLF